MQEKDIESLNPQSHRQQKTENESAWNASSAIPPLIRDVLTSHVTMSHICKIYAYIKI